MKIGTKYFGEIECDSAEIIRFPDGLFGFEEEKEFFLLPFSTQGEDGAAVEGEPWLFSLQSVNTPGLAFVMVNPFVFDDTYAPVLLPEELKKLGVEDSGDLYYYTMCVVRQPTEDSTINLRCPVAINGDTYQAMQVILENDAYQMRSRLGDFTGGREDEKKC